MTKYARVVDGIAMDVMDADPFKSFHPDIAKGFITVPDATVNGAVKNGNKWTLPVNDNPDPLPNPNAQVIIEQKIISVMDFILKFTSSERVAIKSARKADPVIDDFMDIIQDQRLINVDLNSKTIASSLDYLVSKSIIDEKRKLEILS